MVVEEDTKEFWREILNGTTRTDSWAYRIAKKELEKYDCKHGKKQEK